MLGAMFAEGVSALRGCDVLAEDFAVTCPDQKKWLARFACIRGRLTLSHTLHSVGYDGRPEYFTMYACVYNMVRRSAQWLQRHAEELQEERRAFQQEHGFDCAPAEAVARVLRKGKPVQPPRSL